MTKAKSDYEVFRGHVLAWQEKLGLHDWNISAKIDATRNHPLQRQAEVSIGANARNATISLMIHTKRDPNYGLERLALHELLHVLVCDLTIIAAKRALDHHEDVYLEEHKLIERLLKVLL